MKLSRMAVWRVCLFFLAFLIFIEPVSTQVVAQLNGPKWHWTGPNWLPDPSASQKQKFPLATSAKLQHLSKPCVSAGAWVLDTHRWAESSVGTVVGQPCQGSRMHWCLGALATLLILHFQLNCRDLWSWCWEPRRSPVSVSPALPWLAQISFRQATSPASLVQ